MEALTSLKFTWHTCLRGPVGFVLVMVAEVRRSVVPFQGGSMVRLDSVLLLRPPFITYRGGYNDYDDAEDDDDGYYHQYYERKRQQSERKAEAAKRKAEAEARRKAEARQRAQDEGRDCFEEWTVKALNHQEATRRGFTIRGLQSQSIIDLLIDDERNKREERELKELAPLLDEWVEIVDVGDESSRKNLNGIKARAVNYDKGPFLICRAACVLTKSSDDHYHNLSLCLDSLFIDKGRYIVEWDDPAAKKKSQQHRDLYGDKKLKASLEPENVILWGSRPASMEAAKHSTAVHEEEAQKKKSRRERKETATKRREEQQAKKGKQQTENAASKKEDESSMDRYERLVKEMAGTSNQDMPSSFDSTKYILHKVKCPLDKKPGDFFEFTNPHIPGQKQRVQVPPADAKPGKFFKVNVPLPAKKAEPIHMCARCVKHIKPKQDDADIDTVENPLPVGLPLRSCSHHCCEECFPNVQAGGKCPTCSSPLPKPESLDPLPFVQQLDNPPIALKEACIEEYFAGREAERSSAGKNELEALEEASNKATRAVEKHYCRASLKVHPDRYGEEFRKEFDDLTKARDVLRDTNLRRKYLKEMIDIACKVDPGYIPQSHQVWVEKNNTDASESYKPSSKPGKAEASLYLDGGIAFSQAKRPRAFVQSEKARQVRLYLPLSNVGRFVQYCESVTVSGNCGT
jgi:hypothetical protein